MDVSEDEESFNRQEEFERRYNFRIEKPGAHTYREFPCEWNNYM